MFACGIRNPGLWNTEFSLRRESGIPLTIGIYKKSKIHYWEVGNHTSSLRSKRFRLVSKQRKTEERDFRYTCAIFRTVFDSRPSFFAPKLHGNACHAGFHTAESRIQDCLGLQCTLHGRNITHHDTCIVYTKDLYKKSSEKLNMINMIIVYKAGRFFFSFRWQGRIGGMPPRLPRCDPVCCV